MGQVVNADFMRQSQLRAAYEAVHPKSSGTSMPLAVPLAEDDGGHDEDQDDRASYYSDRSDSVVLSESDSSASSDDLDWLPETFRDPFVVREDPAHQFMPVVEFNVDLSTVAEFTDANHFFDEIAAVERYVQCPLSSP
ncbi:hypothetical protein FA95DRAFT_1563854 [Auriscalpium vulgare]|uniref:Uncharacterized protein n=1 Tax=Auriscalpium vulgare TaxID=40419 RepID=A0ACB8RG51_9AGAM|nr:hypothetical protein FA95DRAFT_1563854 [Auriscalpium vulgare]